MSKLKKFVLLLVATFLSVHIAMAEDMDINNQPTYRDGILTIPRVDTPEQVGKYQNAEFEFDQQLKAWRLQSVTTAQDNAPIDEVILSITDSFPAQVFLQVSGEFSSCGKLGEIDQRLQDNKLEIQIHAIYPPALTLCGQAINPFIKVIPLSVYGLNAGDYEYSINGSNNGTFNIPNDNKFGECEGIGDCQAIITGF